jgi:predicted RNase H-like HicB family nuclease
MIDERLATTYTVRADWDPEANVWVAVSDEVPGLATEAATLEALAEKLRILIPELLEANHCATGEPGSELSFEIVGHRRERLLLAS